ncbi:head-tail connector protein [Sulfitobacter sp.]|uniref:head-tail connector protein n=1 Tax=Sulfitobacter sp. TaxID=1903071 RepID=UPI003F6B8DBF
MTLRLITAPAAEPITIVDAKRHLRVTGSDEDEYITSLISAAVAFVDAEGVLGRAMVTQTWAKWVSQAPGYVLIRLGPNTTLTAVDYYDADSVLQSATLGDFETRLEGDFVIVKPVENGAWPAAETRNDAIRLTFTAGYGGAADVPQSVKHALLLLVGHWYENRDAASAVSMSELPLAFNSLLNAHRVTWHG